MSKVFRYLFIICCVFVIPKAVFADEQNPSAATVPSYVKGAYNAAIKAVNTVANEKQDKLTSQNVVTSGSGIIVKSVSATQNSGGLTVTTGEISLPMGSYTPENGRVAV